MAHSEWTNEEDRLLLANFKRMGPVRMARTVFSETHPNPREVMERARALGITHHGRFNVIEGGSRL